MSLRCTVRLPDALGGRLQKEADAQGVALSDLIRRALERLLDSQSDYRAEPLKAPEPVASSTPRPHDCTDTNLARLPVDVREGILARARLLQLSTFQVLRTMLIVQQPPSQSSPQVSAAACPENQRVSWQTFKRQWQQTAEAAPQDAALSSAAQAPRACSPTTDGAPTAPSPAALTVQPS